MDTGNQSSGGDSTDCHSPGSHPAPVQNEAALFTEPTLGLLNNNADDMSGHLNIDQHIEMDDDMDSALGEEVYESTVSALSKMFHFVEEFGRTFHGYKSGKHLLPNDEQEVARLNHQHRMWQFLLNGKLYLAPIENAHRVVDLGTGTGIWAMEFADTYPNSDVLGNDLSPIQPGFVPPNCRFELEDIEDQWLYNYKFDFIHGRHLSPFLRDFSHLFTSICDNLNPGGWVELQDMIPMCQSPDGTLEGTALQRYEPLLLQGFANLGHNTLAAFQYKKWMEKCGFVNVVEKRFAIPCGPWAKGDHWKKLGLMQQANIMGALHGLSMAVFSRGLGWSQQEVEVLLSGVRRDFMDRRIHIFHTVVVVYGQKPL